MPTKRDREYYRMGFADGILFKEQGGTRGGAFEAVERGFYASDIGDGAFVNPSRPKRKLSAWQRYIKNKRNHITYRDGKLNLKAMGVQYRKKKRR
tara:strand:- start:422 stop:706 length:285 start_codon:yes stop_codon:yes gene_type:complete